MDSDKNGMTNGQSAGGHPPDLMSKLASLCKRRGFIFQSSEIYGGVGSVYDYGPLGVELKNNIRAAWWQEMVHRRPDVEGVDAGILMNPRVWEASGHVEGFTDPLVECRNCHRRFRAEDLDGVQCPSCGMSGTFTEPRQFNLMFHTFMGPVQDEASTVYLRPETAQGIYVNFRNIQETARQKVPFGIAQIGKAFRNEITPGNFIFRMREFEQMEMQYFVEPSTDTEWFPDELAHYAKTAFDIQYLFPFGWQEIEGIHNRTDFDLSRHQEYSGKKLEYFDPASGDRFLPFVIETSAGLDRTLLVVLADAYTEEEIEGEQRVLLRLHPRLAPIKTAVFPLVKKDGMPDVAKRVADALREVVTVFYDEAGSIGRRYRRQDEAGTPYCITIDGQTLEDQTVTVRDRDSLLQERVAIDRLPSHVQSLLEAASP
jgi:glycyl-tRNA synthetase